MSPLELVPDPSRYEGAVGLPVEWAEAIAEPHATQEIVEGLVSEGALIVVYGASGSGKTFLMLDLAAHVAASLAWRGRRVRRAIVLYVAAEAGPGIRNRVIAWRRAHGVEEFPLAIITCPVDMRAAVGDVDRIIVTAAEIAKARGAPVQLIVIDTLSRAFGGGDENSSADMGALVVNMDRIRHDTHAAVVLVHHAGKEPAKGARGHSLLRAAVDVEIEVSNEDGLVAATVTKHRDGTTGGVITAKLRPIEIGVNAWGDPLATCILEDARAPEPSHKPRKLPRGCELALRALRDAVTARGESLPATSAVPAGVRAVTLRAWRDGYYSLDTISADDSTTVAKEREARLKRFTRARLALLEAQFAGAINDWNWPQ